MMDESKDKDLYMAACDVNEDLGTPSLEKNCIFKDSVRIMGGRVGENPNLLSSYNLGHIFQGRGGLKNPKGLA